MRKIYSLVIFLIFLSTRSFAQCAIGVGPSYPSGCVSQYFTAITASGVGVTSTISYSAGSCIGTFFNNFTTQGVIAPTGSTVSINVSRLSSYYAYLGVYIDWNNNGIYETTELAGSIVTMPVGMVSTVYNFTIPLIGIVTNTNIHMRVFLGEPPSSGGPLSSINPPCGAKWGEACDYYLNATCTNPTITISPLDPNICGSTESVALTASGAGSTPIYTWSPATGLSATTGAGVTATPGTTRTYTVTGYGPGVCPGTGTTTVSVNPLPVPLISASGPTTFCPGGNVTLTETSGTGTLYQWYAAGSAIAGATTNTYTASPAATTTYSLSLTTAAGCTAGAAVPVTILPVPVAVITPTGPTTVCSPATVTLGGTIGAAYTYQWYDGTGMITGATTQTYTATVTGTYSVQITATGGCSDTSAGVSVTINPTPAPVITASGPTSFCAGSSVTLTETSGTGTVYQWYDATGAIGGATSASYIASPATTTTYSVSLTNSAGCSNGTTITVTILATPVAVITPAGPTTVCTPGTVTLDATAGAGYTYQWYNAGGAIGGASAQTYTATATGSYSVLITSASGCKDTSTGTNVTVTSSPVPVITAGGPSTFCAGGSVVLTETSGTGTLYQWYDGTGAIAGATNAGYTAAPPTTTTYSVSVSNAGGCNAGTTFTVNILPKPVAVITPVGSTTACAPNGVVLNANFAAGYTYRWFTVAGVIAGATSQTYTAFASGDYVVEISTAGGCKDTSATVTVTINPKPVATATASGPLTFCAYDSVVLTAGATPGYTYQWIDGTTIIPGATNIAYTATVVGTHDYRIIVFNGFGCSDTTASGLFVVVVNPAPVSAITASGPLAFCSGGSVTLSVPAVAGYIYQWYSGPSVVTATAISGATNASYTATTTGFYYVIVTTPEGCTTNSSAAPAIVTLVTTPAISHATPLHFCWGSHVTLSVGISTGAVGISIQWMRNSTAIPGATNNTYDATLSGSYTCAITVIGSCTGTTPPVTVEVHPLPDPVITYSGSWLQTYNFYTAYQWYVDVSAISGANTYHIHPHVVGSYAVRVTDTNGCISVADVYPVTNVVGVANVQHTDGPVIAPNPASEMVYVQYAMPVNITITSVDGKKLMEKYLSKEINVSQLASGIYLITLYDEEGKRLKTEKFVKE